MSEKGKPQSKWSLERIALGKRLWGLGLDARACAEQIGVTRNAFLGMAHRKRWLRGEPSEKTKPKPRKAPAMRKPAAKSKPLPEIAPKRVGKVKLLDLDPVPGFHSCRWPVSGSRASTLFCGKRSLDGVSYCGEHQAMSAGHGYAPRVTAKVVQGRLP